MSHTGSVIEQQLKQLESHLEQENPVLLSVVQSFRKLDHVAHKMGLLQRNQSYATQIPWWPLISVLGTFSAGKSTFINHYLGNKLQRSGNQAVDDKFTVICFSEQNDSQSLPGVALDSDPRFPFYKVSGEIEKVAEGEGSRIDSYLQLKTTRSDALKGKIIIDSPGFDADAQRTSTLKITDHIIDLSDLVLVFFDARHPEPGAMRDTLDHLVSSTISRADSGKFLYILNQIDTTAREDNPEEVVAAWQRAMGERGLTAGRFFTIYSPDVANPIENEALKLRYETKRDQDLNEIHSRMQQVEVERAYRIIGALEQTARDIEDKTVPMIQSLLDKWCKRTLIVDAVALTMIISLFATISIKLEQWNGFSYQADWWSWLTSTPLHSYLTAFGAYLLWLGIHYSIRNFTAKSVATLAAKQGESAGLNDHLAKAFKANTKPWLSIFSKKPKGWSASNKARVARVLEETDKHVQSLNDSFTNPSGKMVDPVSTEPMIVD